MRVAWLTVFLVAGAPGQTTDERPEFEVATVKPSKGEFPGGVRYSGGPGSSDPGRFAANWTTPFNLMLTAYELNEHQILCPDWMKKEPYDLVAKIPAGTKRPQFQGMLQRLLEERFQMSPRREERELPVYELVVAKGGLKMKESSGNAPAAPEPGGRSWREVDGEGYPILIGSGTSNGSVNGHITERLVNVPMSRVAIMLRSNMDRPLIDRTGLTGRYDVLLHYVLGRLVEDGTGPSMVEAVQSQLGLKVEAKKAMMKVLVVERAERPRSD
jgi:uncharacterized protein (TIGR03435 family)